MFAILFEVLLIEIQEETIILLVGRGGSRGTKIVNKNFVNKLAFPKLTTFDMLGGRFGYFLIFSAQGRGGRV